MNTINKIHKRNNRVKSNISKLKMIYGSNKVKTYNKDLIIVREEQWDIAIYKGKQMNLEGYHVGANNGVIVQALCESNGTISLINVQTGTKLDNVDTNREPINNGKYVLAIRGKNIIEVYDIELRHIMNYKSIENLYKLKSIKEKKGGVFSVTIARENITFDTEEDRWVGVPEIVDIEIDTINKIAKEV